MILLFLQVAGESRLRRSYSTEVSFIHVMKSKPVFTLALVISGDSFVTRSSLKQQSAGLPRSGKSQGKSKIFQGQGKVREFCKRSGKISVLVKVSEKSGNFVFRFCEVYEDIFIRKKRSCSRSSYVFKWRVFRSVKCHAFKIP